MADPAINRYMRRKAVAFELGINRHTLARMIKTDPTFPPFMEITPGVEVIARDDFERWLREKRLAALTAARRAQSDPVATGLDIAALVLGGHSRITSFPPSEKDLPHEPTAGPAQ